MDVVQFIKQAKHIRDNICRKMGKETCASLKRQQPYTLEETLEEFTREQRAKRGERIYGNKSGLPADLPCGPRYWLDYGKKKKVVTDKKI